jgi:predicted outer membrane repeat protein
MKKVRNTMSKRVNPHIRLITMGLLLVIWSSTTVAETIFVDANSPGPIRNGNSWLTAYNYLQDALADAVSGDEIRVANGTYRPDPTGLFDPRGATFQLINGVTIRGGYAGCGAPDPNQRDVQNNVTTLSGDLLGNDPSRADNCYHVVSGTGTNTSAVIDGFTITGGNATSTSGGGMYNNPGSPTVLNCIFRGNSATVYGGGMYNRNFNSELIDCTFTGNSADKYGGGLYNQTSSPEITNCTFTQNSSLKRGGGICNYSSSNPEVTNCRFTGNSATERGGGIYNYSRQPQQQ